LRGEEQELLARDGRADLYICCDDAERVLGTVVRLEQLAKHTDQLVGRRDFLTKKLFFVPDSFTRASTGISNL